MRVLVATLMLCAGMAEATPDHIDGSQTQSSDPVTVDESSNTSATRSSDAPATITDERRQQVVMVSPRPKLRPARFRKITLGRERMRKRGAVCDDWTILGQTVKSFTGKYRGCGISDPVRVRMISDIELSQKSLMDCRTAVVLKTWIENTAKPAFADMGGGLKKLHVVGHYSCRTRNNLASTRISEHGKGRAIDIAIFQLVDGTLISVQDGWNAAYARGALRKLHSGACGLFGTVLGPDSDQFHRDHFHFDTARHRSTPYCR